MGKATKAADSAYYLARIRAAEQIDDLGSREGAAEHTGIERTRLARIELNTIVPHPDEVRVMADAYNAPELMHYYCSHDCPIGKCMGILLPSSQASTVEQLAVQAAVALRGADMARERLLDISADGMITEDEKSTLDWVLKQLGQISQVAHQLQAYVLKLQ